jgi:hypothetical protein
MSGDFLYEQETVQCELFPNLSGGTEPTPGTAVTTPILCAVTISQASDAEALIFSAVSRFAVLDFAALLIWWRCIGSSAPTAIVTVSCR